VLEYLQKQGVVEAELDVDDTKPTKAIVLYRKVGFHVVKKAASYQ
jgi:ribosomal protein S18 acetylase RimI-like enzyme